jgi:hypothetical protein
MGITRDPYKQRVTGSSPVVPTKPRRNPGLLFLRADFNYGFFNFAPIKLIFNR